VYGNNSTSYKAYLMYTRFVAACVTEAITREYHSDPARAPVYKLCTKHSFEVCGHLTTSVVLLYGFILKIIGGTH
jgi:hypothetical protein